nr:unnamed protein product [Callosobruchus chinensis]
MVTLDICNEVRDWRVFLELSLSHYRYILFKIYGDRTQKKVIRNTIVQRNICSKGEFCDLYPKLRYPRSPIEDIGNKSSDINFTEAFLEHKRNEESKVFNIHSTSDLNNDPISEHEFEDALPLTTKSRLSEIFSRIWATQVFPNSWKRAIIIPIRKPNKSSLMPDSYRYIALTCTRYKLVEKIINQPLLWSLETKNLLVMEQEGFRPQRSTADNILELESQINEAFSNRSHCMVIYFDISNAFDIV